MPNLDTVRVWLRRGWVRDFIVLPAVLWFWFYVTTSFVVLRFHQDPGMRVLAQLLNIGVIYLIWDTARLVYTVMLIRYKPHQFFWIRFAIALAAELLLLQAGIFLGLLGTAITAFLIRRNYNEAPPPVETRGVEGISDLSTAREKYRPKRGEPSFLFGDVNIPLKYASQNIALVGTVGSGKTVNLKLLMQEMLPGIGLRDDAHRAVVYDPNRDFYSYLEALGIPAERLLVMNPYDRRCRPWDMSSDILTATDAQALAEILVPPEKGNSNDDFWRKMTVLWLKATVRYFNYHAAGQWRFRDVLLAVRNREILDRICEDPKLQHYLQLWGSDRTAQNIMASILSYMEQYEPIAALWHKAEKIYGNQPVSLTEWINSSSVLLLGRDETARSQMRELNRLLLSRLMQLLIGKSERHSPDTFFFLDEFGSLGEMGAIVELSTEGRKKGASLIVGFQAESQLQENYGEQQCNTILGQFNHVMALRVNDAQTAEWVSNRLGEIEMMRYHKSVTKSFMGGESETISEHLDRPKLIMPSELLGIPQFDPERGVPLRGFVLGGATTWPFSYAPRILKKLVQPVHPEDNFMPMPRGFQEIDLWNADDYKRLKLRPPGGGDNPPQGDAPDTNSSPDDAAMRLQEILERRRQGQDRLNSSDL